MRLSSSSSDAGREGGELILNGGRNDRRRIEGDMIMINKRVEEGSLGHRSELN